MKNEKVTAVWKPGKEFYCDGTWFLNINGHDFSRYIPDVKRHEPMNTLKDYVYWMYDEYGDVIFRKGEYGKPYKVWIEDNEWAREVCEAVRNMLYIHVDPIEIYEAIREVDFTRSSCGRCLLKHREDHAKKIHDLKEEYLNIEGGLSPDQFFTFQKRMERLKRRPPKSFTEQMKQIEKRKRRAKWVDEPHDRY